IKIHFRESGYTLYFDMLNANDYGVAQDRKRVFFVGFREDLNIEHFSFPKPLEDKPTLKDSIWDLQESVVSADSKNYSQNCCEIANHEYMVGGFSSMFMSRNRVRGWDEPSFTIQAGGRHAPLHPQAPKMEKIEKDKQRFIEGSEHLYRRLSIRECARVQSFPDKHRFYYKNLAAGYKMVGNAVPPTLAFHIASSIKRSLRLGREKEESRTTNLFDYDNYTPSLQL
ncbi:MAG: DNA (cytosine-5-)-methyltransferase, partial [Campylobacterota bacterium]|nr:DNA (cytosine-5-)-methyltransferase [Campylobacterota bacterium]